MIPRAAPLSLSSYFVTDIGCSANPEFDPEREIKLQIEDVQTEARVQPPQESGDVWQIQLTIQQNVRPDRNSPYNFHIQLRAGFTVHPDFPARTARQLAETTGASILYGAAREILRGVMAAGPFHPLILPSVSFHPAAPHRAPERPREAPIVKARARRKKPAA